MSKQHLAFTLLVATIAVAASQVADADLITQLDASNSATVIKVGGGQAGNGDSIASWVDTVATGGLQSATPQIGNPTYNATGGPLGQGVIDFTAADSNLVTASGSLRTIVLVHRWDAGPSAAYLVDTRNGINPGYVLHAEIGGFTAYVNDSLTNTTDIADLRSSDWQVTTLVHNTGGTAELTLFSRYSENERASGLLGEVRVYDTALSQSERLAVVDELNSKWLVPEPSGLLLAAIGLFSLVFYATKRR